MLTRRDLGRSNIPSALGTLGLVPGLIILVLFALLTGWTDFYIGTFKLLHPQVCESAPRFRRARRSADEILRAAPQQDSLADCGRLMYGRAGSVVFGIATWMCASPPSRPDRAPRLERELTARLAVHAQTWPW